MLDSNSGVTYRERNARLSPVYPSELFENFFDALRRRDLVCSHALRFWIGRLWTVNGN